MLNNYLEHTMIAAYLGPDVVSDPSALFTALAAVDLALAIPLFLGFRFLNRDPDTGGVMFGKLSPGEHPSLLGLSRGRLAAFVILIIGIPFIGGGLYPIPPFVAEDGSLIKRLYATTLMLFLLATVLVDLLVEGKLRRY